MEYIIEYRDGDSFCPLSINYAPVVIPSLKVAKKAFNLLQGGEYRIIDNFARGKRKQAEKMKEIYSDCDDRFYVSNQKYWAEREIVDTTKIRVICSPQNEENWYIFSIHDTREEAKKKSDEMNRDLYSMKFRIEN